MNQRKAGAILSNIHIFISVIAGLLTISIILKVLSDSDYGVYVIMGSLIAVMGVMDFGLSGTMTRYYTRSMVLHDEKMQENTLATGTIIYAAIGIITVIVGFILYPLIGTIYSAELTAAELVLAKRMFIVMMASFVISISTNIFTSVISAHERFVFLKLVDIVVAILNPILVYILVYSTKNIMAVVLIHASVNILAVIARIYYALGRLKVKIKFHYFDKELFSAITAFAFFIFLNMIMDRIYWQTDNLILGAVAGTQAVAVYGIAATLNRHYLNFSSNIASVFLPKITKISSTTDDMTEINEVFIRIGRIQYIIIMLLLTGFIIFGQEFIRAWAGAGKENAYYFSLIVMIPLVIPLIQNTGISILQAKNKHRFRSMVYIFIAVLNFGASIPLAKLYGGFGCAAATGVSLLIGQGVIINIYYKKKIGLEIGEFFKQIGSMTPPILILGVVAYFANQYIITSEWYWVGLKILVYCVIYFIVAENFVFNAYEKDSFTGWLKRVLWRARK